VWRRRRKAASPTALYSTHHGLYSEAVVSSVASAVALAEVGQFRETVEYVQKAAKALYEAARDVFERVRVSLQRLVELFVEAVTRVLAWVDEHKAYLFLMAAGVIALAAALNMWGLVELEKLAYAASAPFVAAGVKVDERKVAEAVRLVEGALGKTPTLVPGGGVLAEVERWVAGLRSGEVKAAVARAAEELEKWLKAVKSGICLPLLRPVCEDMRRRRLRREDAEVGHLLQAGEDGGGKNRRSKGEVDSGQKPGGV
jgi:hypothetical protein